ncbi:hypothetical protein MVEN_00323000 [Mycena venus]|uniref:Uncharacterized protein n=1 Tax=Mycena venus TaxID=2733690 RepID=A0A8H7D7S1_9AGAR|nr:hypothetical protein MVEN_00323000 [Mycena venus]
MAFFIAPRPCQHHAVTARAGFVTCSDPNFPAIVACIVVICLAHMPGYIDGIFYSPSTVSTSRSDTKHRAVNIVMMMYNRMMVISATAVYASLPELCMTGEHQLMAFTEDAFEDIYRIHLQPYKERGCRVRYMFFADVMATARAVQMASGSSATRISLVDANSD